MPSCKEVILTNPVPATETNPYYDIASNFRTAAGVVLQTPSVESLNRAKRLLEEPMLQSEKLCSSGGWYLVLFSPS